MRPFVPLLSSVVFAVGLALSGMTQPARVVSGHVLVRAFEHVVKPYVAGRRAA